MSSDKSDEKGRDKYADRERGPTRREHTAGFGNETNRSDPRSLRCRVFIGNLATDKISRQELEKIFLRHGKVTGVSLHNNYAFVQYADEIGADEAVAKEHGQTFFGKKIDVNLAGDRKKSERRGPPPTHPRDPHEDPFRRDERERDRDRRSPLRERGRFEDYDRFPSRFERPFDQYRRSPSPGRRREEHFGRPLHDRREDPYERDRFRDDPYFRDRGPPPMRHPPPDMRDLPPERRGLPPDRRDLPSGRRDMPPERRDIPPERRDLPLDRRDMPLDRRDMPPDRRDMPPDPRALSPGRSRRELPPLDRRDSRPPLRRGLSPERRDTHPPPGHHEDPYDRDRRDPYGRPDPYYDRRDGYHRYDSYDRGYDDYPPAKRPRSDYDERDSYSSKPVQAPTDCVILVINKQQR